jgi:MATE family multidrug resistance protein
VSAVPPGDSAPEAGGPSHRRILGLALPIIASNVSTPLLGLVDTAVIGRIADPAPLGAVAVGALVFTFVFWGFGFLRMGTTGLTAQARGGGDGEEVRAALGRAVLLALLFGGAILLLQVPIGRVAWLVLDAGPEVEGLAAGYFAVRVWAAPATLLNYGLLGWFVGLGRTRLALLLQVVLNGTNMAVDTALVLGLGWGVEGVAAGSLAAEVLAAVLGLFLARRVLAGIGGRFDHRAILDGPRLRRTLLLHRDILVRSLALVSVFGWFTASGAALGDAVLAANAVLLQLVGFASFFLDGIAFATEALVGEAVGGRHRQAFLVAVRRTGLWAAGVALGITGVYLTAGGVLVDLLTVDPATRQAARPVLPWAAWAPAVGVGAYQLDGIFIGATRGREMRDAMLVALASYLAAWWACSDLGNVGLWAAFHVHFVARLGAMLWYLPRAVPAAGHRAEERSVKAA